MTLSRFSRSAVAVGASGALALSSVAVGGAAFAAQPTVDPVAQAGGVGAAAAAASGSMVTASPPKVHVRQKNGKSVIKIRSAAFDTLDYPVDQRGKLSAAQKNKVSKARAKSKRRAVKLRKRMKARNKNRVGRVAFASLFGLTGNMGRFEGMFTATTSKGRNVNVAFRSGAASVRFKKGKKPLLSVVNNAKPADLSAERVGAAGKLDTKKASTKIPSTRGNGARAYRDAELAGQFARMAAPPKAPADNGAATPPEAPENKWSFQADEAKVTPIGNGKYEIALDISPGGVTRQVAGENGSAVKFTAADYVDNMTAAIDGKDAPLTITGLDADGEPVTFEATLLAVEAADAPAAAGPARNPVTLTVSADGVVTNLNDYTQLRIYSETYHKGNPVLVIIGDSIASGEGGRWRATLQTQGLGKDKTADTASCFWGADMSCTPDPDIPNAEYTPDNDKVYMRDWGYRKNATKPELQYKCHRSRTAPGLWLADFLSDQEAVAVSGFNYACSGATTDNVISAANGGEKFQTQPKPQADMLADVAKVYYVDQVVMTIGANDIGFSETAADCVAWLINPRRSKVGCRGDEEGLKTTAALKTLDQKVTKAIDDVLAAAPTARLIVSDYLSPIAELGERLQADHQGTSSKATKFNGQSGYNPRTEVEAACKNEYNNIRQYVDCYSNVSYWSANPGNLGKPTVLDLCFAGCTKSGQAWDAVMGRFGVPPQTRGRGAGEGNFWKWGFKNLAVMPAKMNIPLGGPDRVWIHQTLVPDLATAVTKGVANSADPSRIDRMNMKYAANGRSVGSMTNDGSLNSINGNQNAWYWGKQPGTTDSVMQGSVNGFPAGPGGQTTKAGLRATFFTPWILAARSGTGGLAGGSASGSDGDWVDEGRKTEDLPGDLQEALHPNARGQMALGLCLAMKYMKGAAQAKVGTGDYCVREPGHSVPAVNVLPSYSYKGQTINRGEVVPDKVCLVSDPNARVCPTGVGIEDTNSLLVDGIPTGEGNHKWENATQANMVWEDWE